MTLKKIKARLTAFASSPKFTKGVRLWKKFMGLPPITFPKDQTEWDAASPQLYQTLENLVDKLIVAEDADLAYQPPKRDPHKAQLDTDHVSRENDLIELWSFLRRYHLLPVDSMSGFQWIRWQSFVKSVRRDKSVFSRIRHATRSVSHEQALTA